MDEVSGINIIDYPKKKTAGLVDLAKIGKAHAISVRRFSSETGEEIDPQIIAISIKSLEDSKTSLQRQMDAIDIIISDIKALK